MHNCQVNVTVLASSVDTGGAESVLFHLLLGLNRDRFRPRLICLRETGFTGSALQAKGIPTVSGISRGKFDPLVGRRLVQTIREQPDILYCLSQHDVLFWASYLMRRLKVKSNVLICHSTKSRSGGHWFRATDRPALRRMQRVIAVARGQKRYLVEDEGLPAGRIEVIYNGVSLMDSADESLQQADRALVRQELGLTEEHRVAIILAHLRPEKNHARFLRVARAVTKRLPEARFIVAGDGPERSKVEAYARALGVAEFVHFLGVRRDIPRLLTASDVITLTSDDRVETFPMALLEGMAARRPVVATRVGSLEEMVIEGKNGHLIPVDDEAAFAEALYRVLSDRTRAKVMGEAGRHLVLQRFKVEDMVQAHERLFEQLLKEAAMGNR